MPYRKVFHAPRSNCIGATLEDATLVPQIAQQFHATVLNRRDPDCQMLVQFIPEKPEFTAGEAVIVTLRITNTGRQDFVFMQGGREHFMIMQDGRRIRDNQFAFSAKKDDGTVLADSGDPRNFGGLRFPLKLKPLQSYEAQVDLTQWFKFKPHTEYQIKGSYGMSFVDPESQSLDTIWEGSACGEFRIKTK